MAYPCTVKNTGPALKSSKYIYRRISSRTTAFVLCCIALLLGVSISQVFAKWDPYQIIGVERTASFEQIKKAYRDLAKKLHPDKRTVKEDDSGKRFIELNKAFDLLKDPVKRNRYDKFGDEAFVQLNDEPYPGLLNRLLWRLLGDVLQIIHRVVSYQTTITVIILTICASITSFILYSSPATPANYPNENETTKQNLPRQPGTDSVSREDTCDQLSIRELKAETYYGMIRLLKPGHRSIILLCDLETKETLLPAFKRTLWPYRRNKTLLYGFLCLDKNLNWYKCLLQEVLGVDNLILNKKRCVGTVLSLNGFKKYFRVYHAKHIEFGDQYEDDDEQGGSFLGFDGNQEDNIESGTHDMSNQDLPQGLPVHKLLDRLPIWLDKMFDGLTKRYFVDVWPDDMK